MVNKIDHEKAIALRMAGKSYNEIAKELGVWKSSLSYWLRGLELPIDAVKILEKKNAYTKVKFQESNKQKHTKRLEENKNALKTFSEKIERISDYQLLLIGASLYWGEGYKKHTKKTINMFLFVTPTPK